MKVFIQFLIISTYCLREFSMEVAMSSSNSRGKSLASPFIVKNGENDYLSFSPKSQPRNYRHVSREEFPSQRFAHQNEIYLDTSKNSGKFHEKRRVPMSYRLNAFSEEHSSPPSDLTRGSFHGAELLASQRDPITNRFKKTADISDYSLEDNYNEMISSKRNNEVDNGPLFEDPRETPMKLLKKNVDVKLEKDNFLDESRWARKSHKIESTSSQQSTSSDVMLPHKSTNLLLNTPYKSTGFDIAPSHQSSNVETTLSHKSNLLIATPLQMKNFDTPSTHQSANVDSTSSSHKTMNLLNAAPHQSTNFDASQSHPSTSFETTSPHKSTNVDTNPPHQSANLDVIPPHSSPNFDTTAPRPSTNIEASPNILSNVNFDNVNRLSEEILDASQDKMHGNEKQKDHHTNEFQLLGGKIKQNEDNIEKSKFLSDYAAEIGKTDLKLNDASKLMFKKENIGPENLKVKQPDSMNLKVSINGLVVGDENEEKVFGQGALEMQAIEDGKEVAFALLKDRKKFKEDKENENSLLTCKGGSTVCQKQTTTTPPPNPNPPRTEDSLTTRKLSKEISKMLSTMLCSNPKIKTLWPSLGRVKPFTSPSPGNNLREMAKCSDRKNIEDLLRRAMESVNNIIEQEVQARSCITLSEEMAEFYEMILAIHAEQAKNKRQEEELLKQAETLDEDIRTMESSPKKCGKAYPSESGQKTRLQKMRSRKMQFGEELSAEHLLNEMQKREQKLEEDTRQSHLIRELRRMYTKPFMKLTTAAERLGRTEISED